MKKFACAALVCAAICLLGANSLITQHEALVSGALNSLKFESVPGRPGLVGAPPKFKVNKQTLEFLDQLLKEGKVIEVQNDGAIKILDAKK